jgi:aminoglycoside phosphotransferase family enzyme/predicted kinase
VNRETPEEPPPGTDDGLPAYVHALLDPAAFPNDPPSVALVQTHISFVFLAGDRVYKTKKPVDLGFVDQTDAATRHEFCEREVRLNRRLAPEVYLGVTPVVRFADGRHRVIEGETPTDAEVVEWAVEMRRLPDEATLAHLLEIDAVPPGLVRRLAAKLVEFHAAAEVVPNDPAFAGAAGQLEWWAREQGEASPFIGDTWDVAQATALTNYANAVLERESALFDRRLAEGRVVDGHGDLHAQHVYVLDDEIVIVDCLEFTDAFQFRLLDAGYDVAFLAMDLEARGHPELGDELAGRYIAAVGDETMPVLQPLHRAFRAFVRGKVNSMGANEPEEPPAEQERLAESAGRYFELAARIVGRAAEPVVVLLAGRSGTGKSTVGAALAGRIGAAYVSSDVTRKRLAGLGPREHVPAERTAEVYGEAMNARTYEAMRVRAAEHLAAGRPVVLDATHSRAEDRLAALAMARAARVPALIAELCITDETALQRIAERSAEAMSTSDATAAVFEAQAASFEPIGASEGVHLALDASQELSALVDEIADSLHEAG